MIRSFAFPARRSAGPRDRLAAGTSPGLAALALTLAAAVLALALSTLSPARAAGPGAVCSAPTRAVVAMAGPAGPEAERGTCRAQSLGAIDVEPAVDLGLPRQSADPTRARLWAPAGYPAASEAARPAPAAGSPERPPRAV